MASEYRIQVVDVRNERVAEWAPGLDVEKQLVSELTDRIQAKLGIVQTFSPNELITRIRAKGVGVFRTEDHVVADVRAAIQETSVLTQQQMWLMVHSALEELLYDLKKQV